MPKFVLDEDGEPGERNDVVLAGLNHKMGNRGTTNCLLNFGEGKFTPQGKAGAIGYLVGKPHQGLANMFHMMNEARIGVGLGAAVLGVTGYLHALDYARNRPQGRHPAEKDPAKPQVPIIGHTDVRRMLLAQKAYVEGALALVLYCARLVDEQHSAETPEARRHAGQLLDFLTPIAKSWPSQWCVEANSLAIQVHGGYGYTREYNVEQFYRDNRLNAIHEGTHGIHGLDLLGRKVTMQDGALFKAVGAELAATVASGARARRAGRTAALRRPARSSLARRSAEVTASPVRRRRHEQDPGQRQRLPGSGRPHRRRLDLAGAGAAGGAPAAPPTPPNDQDFYRGKLQACRYFFTGNCRRSQPQLDLLASIDTTTLDMQDAWF